MMKMNTLNTLLAIVCSGAMSSAHAQEVQVTPAQAEKLNQVERNYSPGVGMIEAADEEFQGTIGTTLADSEEWWPPPVAPPEGAPNVLIWLIDDMGYGHSSVFGGLTPCRLLMVGSAELEAKIHWCRHGFRQ